MVKIAVLLEDGAVNALDRLCLASFVAAGHDVEVYGFHAMPGLPNGCRFCDAREVLPLDGASGRLPGYLVDLFRVRLLSLCPGSIWVARYVFCLAPLHPEGGRLLGRERRGAISTRVLALPSGGEALTDLTEVMADPRGVPPHLDAEAKVRLVAARDAGAPVHVRDLPWGVWGASLLTHVLEGTGEVVHAADASIFCPVSFSERHRLLEPGVALADVVSDAAKCLPLFGKSLIRDLGLAGPDPTSVLGGLLQTNGIEWAPTVDVEAPVVDAELPVPLAAGQEDVRPLDKVVAIALVTNEGPHILDWVAYHLSIGVTHFLLYSHGSDDPTAAILDALAARGLVTHEVLSVKEDQTPERAVHTAARRHGVVEAANAVIVMDVDEYINVHVGAGRLSDLFQAAGDPDLISMTWRLFGSGGHLDVADQPVPERCTLAAPRACSDPPHAWAFKTIVRKEAAPGSYGAHRPHKFSGDAALTWVNGSGAPMPERYWQGGWRSGKECWGYDLVTLNHYAVRSCESFLVARNGGARKTAEESLEDWRIFNRNEEVDRSILPRFEGARALRFALAEDPILGPLHDKAVAWHKARAADLKSVPRESALFDHIAAEPLSSDIALIDLPERAPLPETVVEIVDGFPLRADPPALGAEAEAQFQALMARTQAKHGVLTPLADPPRSERIVAVSSMKNEGCFILEWIAYHLSIGVTHFLIYTNDCDDPTDAILDRLAKLGYVTRLDNPFNADAGQRPQRGALNDAASRPEVVLADWVGVIDVDEFVNIHVGDGTFSALLAAAGDPNVISMTWRFFGSRGVHAFEDRWQTELFTRCAPLYLPKPRLGWGFKSFHRPDGPFDKLGVHRPLGLDPDHLGEVRWVNGAGRVMPDRVPLKNEWFSRKDTVGYNMVTLNHYVLRSAESFLVKRQRGRINHVEQDQGAAYWTARNYATETDASILRHLPRAKAVLDRLLKDVTLMRLHEEAVHWHRNRIQALLAEDEYRALYDAITDQKVPDAIWRAQPPKDETSVAAE